IADVARDHQKGLTTAAMIPELAMSAGRIVAQIYIIHELCRRIRRPRIGTPQGRITVIAELPQVAAATMGARDSHHNQCRFGWAPAPRSSSSRPVWNRSNR